MAKAKDVSVEFPGLTIIHQKIRGHGVGQHEHEDHEFFFPLQGEIQILAQGKTLRAGPGRLVYLPANVAHSFQSDTSSQGERVILIVQKRLWKKFARPQILPSVISMSQLCKEIVFQLLIHPKTRASPALIETLITILSEMLELGTQTLDSGLGHLSGRAGDDRVRRALEWIEENYAEALSAESIARKAGLSVRNLNRLFLQELSLSPKNVLIHFRVEAAKRLLGEKRMTVTDIAMEVGYSSLSQFIATFRRHTGQLPSSYKPDSKT